MPNGRWTNPSQPQTLVIAVFLLYVQAAFGVIGLLQLGIASVVRTPLLLAALGIQIGGGVAAGKAIADERRWGYSLGLVVAFTPFVISFLATHGNPFGADFITQILPSSRNGKPLHG